MNVEVPFADNDVGFWILAGIMAGVLGASVAVFRRRGLL
jgi:Mg2+ and Co2+ transporter CorA